MAAAAKPEGPKVEDGVAAAAKAEDPKVDLPAPSVSKDFFCFTHGVLTLHVQYMR